MTTYRICDEVPSDSYDIEASTPEKAIATVVDADYRTVEFDLETGEEIDSAEGKEYSCLEAWTIDENGDLLDLIITADVIADGQGEVFIFFTQQAVDECGLADAGRAE